MPEPSFVCASGIHFSLDQQPFRVVGANNYYLGFESDLMVEPVFELASQVCVYSLRPWAFLVCGAAATRSTHANAKDGVFFHYQNSATGKVEFNDGPNGLERLDR